MSRLTGKTVFITGATSGIGKSCAYAFANEGANIIITARRIEKLNEIAEDIKTKSSVNLLALKLDVQKRNEVKKVVSDLPEEWKKIDVLVNNAGLGRGLNKLYEDNPDGWDEMIDTNVKGLLYVTREIIPQMIERKEGHIIMIGSIAGREPYSKGAVYCATKFAVNAITRSLRLDVVDKNIRISTVDPGLVETNFSEVRFYGDSETAKNVYKGLKPLVGDDIADAVIYVATRPAHVNIAEMVVFPTAQAAATTVHRE